MFEPDAGGTDGKARKKSGAPVSSMPLKPVTGKALDRSAMVRLHHRLLDHITREIDRQADNRREQAIDADVYDNIQWNEADLKVMEDRGQVPLTFNVTATTVDWVIGSEKRSRTDFKVLPRRKGDSKPAQRKSELLKYLADVNRDQFETSQAFEDAAKVGIGWLEDGYQGDDDGEPIYSRYETWRNMLWDSTAIRPDLEDARYIIRNKWVDLDVACSIFPKRHELLRRSVDDADGLASLDAYGDEAMDSQEMESQGYGDSGTTSDHVTGYRRSRLRIFEIWFRMPVTAGKLKGGMFTGEIFDEYSPGHLEQVEQGEADVVHKPMMRTFVALITTAGMLWLSPSPYRHNRYPFTAIWNKRRDRDGMPYGMIRNIRDIQLDINKRASKSLHILSTNKIVMDEGAVDDVDELAEEVARPDSIIVVKGGKNLKLDVDRELAPAHLDMMSRNIAMLQQVGGVTDENLGRTTNAVSGRAIEARQSQGQLTTAKLFDNLRLTYQVRGEKKLSLLEQFMSEEKKFRITNQRGTPEYVTVNDGLPENDIVRSKADFIISEEDWRASVRQAQVDSFMELLGKLAPMNPQIVIVALDLVVEAMDIPQREELVKRIRQVTGMADPDSEEPDQAQIAKQQADQAQQQINMETTMAQLRKLISEAVKNEAQAEELRARTAGANITTQNTAIDAASKVAIAPGIADVADLLLHESGFVGRSEGESVEAAAQAAQQQQAQAAQQEAAAVPQQTPPGAPAPDANALAIGLG